MRLVNNNTITRNKICEQLCYAFLEGLRWYPLPDLPKHECHTQRCIVLVELACSVNAQSHRIQIADLVFLTSC